jgi:phage terminase large subunit-like protein
MTAALDFIKRQIKLPSGRTLADGAAADPWIEENVLSPILEEDEDGLPANRLCWIEMHRGSGKTTFAAAIAVEEACRYPNTQIYALACDASQAGLLGEAVDAFSQQNQLLAGALRRTTHEIRLGNGSRIRIMSSDAASFFGLGVGAQRLRIIADEVCQWPKRDLLDAALTTLPKIRNSQLVCLTNAGIKGSWQEEARLTFEQTGYLYAPQGLVASWIRPEDVERLRQAMPDSVYRRYYLNEWVGAESEFVALEDWDACARRRIPRAGSRTPLVVGIDAAVTGDCFAIVAVSRNPEHPLDGVAVRECAVWAPPRHGLDFMLPWRWLEDFCAGHPVAQICYDPFQLHDWAMRFSREHGVWCEPVEQGQERLKADGQLLQLIKSKRLVHAGQPELRQHVANAALRIAVREDTRGRIVKSMPSQKIDAVVALSMAAYRCLYLRMENLAHG